MPMISLLPTARRVDVRWFQDLSFSTDVLYRVAILARVSPARTVYVRERAEETDFETGFLAEVCLVLEATSCG